MRRARVDYEAHRHEESELQGLCELTTSKLWSFTKDDVDSLGEWMADPASDGVTETAESSSSFELWPTSNVAGSFGAGVAVGEGVSSLYWNNFLLGMTADMVLVLPYLDALLDLEGSVLGP
ncbi:hypothetical protein OGATHE_006163 [Ogataea polymorpha]|uniref:Uncharacterized protein n=1 Tax=Ogataea polymorpha TaxID=460523 RepID=A0A9P8NUG1_9ASCO|nr:hypothetical protein OGATHE_006163 [Ogataea polymorpha]